MGRRLLDDAFTALGLHGVLLHDVALNEPALRLDRRLGFREVGPGRVTQRHDGRFWT